MNKKPYSHKDISNNTHKPKKFTLLRFLAFLLRSFTRFLRHCFIAIATMRFYTKSNHTPSNTLIIIRLDAIGDYMLFRNFLSLIRSTYPTHHITLVGNIAWKDLSLCLDKQYYNCAFFIDRNIYYKRIFYTIKVLRQLKTKHYDILLSPTFSRDKITIQLSLAIHATQKIAPLGDCINLEKESKIKSDRIFTQLTPSKPSTLFEFYRNQEFFSHFLQQEVNVKLYIDEKALPNINHLLEPNTNLCQHELQQNH